MFCGRFFIGWPLLQLGGSERGRAALQPFPDEGKDPVAGKRSKRQIGQAERIGPEKRGDFRARFHMIIERRQETLRFYPMPRFIGGRRREAAG